MILALAQAMHRRSAACHNIGTLTPRPRLIWYSSPPLASPHPPAPLLSSPSADCHVVDLRDNAGGFFRGGVDTAALFLDADTPIVSVINKDGLQVSVVARRAAVRMLP